MRRNHTGWSSSGRRRRNEERLGGSAMQYAHWLIVVGAVLVVLGFIGFALHKNDGEPADDRLTRDTSSETIQAALEAELKAKEKGPDRDPRDDAGLQRRR